MKVKVRHGVVRFRPAGSATAEVAFRGMVVDMPSSEVDRLRPEGAVVGENDELTPTGQILPLNEAPSDQELINWVLAATPAEVGAMVTARPTLAPRLDAAIEYIEQHRDRTLDALADALSTARDAVDEPPELEADPGTGASQDPDQTGGPTPQPEGTGTEDGGTPPGAVVGELTAERADEIVKGNVDTVTRYISENPTHAQAILDAERRRSVAANDDVRSTVARAVAAAVGHTQ